MEKALEGIVYYRNDLDIDLFSHVLDNNSQCYKFYWLESIIRILVRENKKAMTFNEIADEMVVCAWYTVAEFHLHMGSPYAGNQDVGALEKIISKLQRYSELTSNADEGDIRYALSYFGDLVHEEKIQLTSLVPHKLLSSYVKLPGNKKKSLVYIYDLIKAANAKSECPLPYVIEYGKDLNKTVILNDLWADFIVENASILLGWIDSKKIKYLQDRNPGVPGIVYKLRKSGERTNLKNVRDLWKSIGDRDQVVDIFTGEALKGSAFAIDHFIPWTYVTSDELWNLNPIDKHVNSAKNNRLPDWSIYFPGFLRNQFQLYIWTKKDESINRLFLKCANQHINSLWASAELYNPNHDLNEFGRILEENMKPIYVSAKLQGFEVWHWEV